MPNTFTPTRTDALTRLSAFVPHAGRAYATRRNYDLGPGNHRSVSTLSPYLRCRIITEAEVVQAVVGRHSTVAAEKFIQEVFWRAYWKGWLELRPQVWAQYQSALNQQWNAIQTQSDLRGRWEAACKGDTEIECFNAWAQELVSTGYLHNHARMWFASIWIFTLELPWELGADFFLRHLLDGAPASNTLGWRWVAGIQPPGKTYLARTSNISKYTEGRFHPKWQLASNAPARIGPPVPEPLALPQQLTPEPGLRSGFLLHEEDLSPGDVLGRMETTSSAVLMPQTKVGPLQSAPAVAEFRRAAQQDVVARWGPRLGKVDVVADASEISTWAKNDGLEQIITPYAPVGPVADVLRELTQSPSSPRICAVVRDLDAAAWPKATHGFFKFKKQMPALIKLITQP